MFINLHVHDDGSALDSMAKTKDLVQRAKELGQEAIAITNHGNMITAYDFQKYANELGVKPIFGCEFYMGEKDTDDRHHLVLLAMSDKGVSNLFELQKYSWLSNFKGKPRLDLNVLERFNEDLICLTACLGGQLATTKDVSDLSNLFGDRLYYELQVTHNDEQRKYNEWLVSNFDKSRLVVTTDAHFVDREDYITHKTLMSMQYKKKLSDEKFNEHYHTYYAETNRIMNKEEVINDLNYLDISITESAINNTYKIAKMCNATIKTGLSLLPKVSDNAEQELRQLCMNGLKWRKEQGHFDTLDFQEVKKRVAYEFSIICQKGYPDYFIIEYRLMNYCRENDIFVGPGRGSVCGSMIAFVLGISEVEPMKYGLLFERFLNPDRNTQPDVDSDFCYNRRHEVIEYLKEEYGSENVATISAIGKMKTKAVIKKVMSSHSIDNKFVNLLNKQIVDESSYKEAFVTTPQVREFMKQNPAIHTDIKKLEGTISHISKHAAGLVIAPDKIHKYCPVMRDEDDHSMMKLQWDKKQVESVGLYKFDILGLKQATIFDKCLKSIGKDYSLITELIVKGLNDPLVYDTFNSGDLCGIFQFDAPAGAQTISKVQPTCFEDIVVATSICRPGVKEANDYLNRTYDSTGIAEIDNIIGYTRNCIVYQEQTMLLMNKIAGWSLGKADGMRKVKNLEEYREDFIEGSRNNGYNEDVAMAIFNRFDLGYSFNKSHAVAYSFNSYVGAYLKTYHRAHYMAPALTLELTKQEPEIEKFMAECKKYGIKFIPPCVNNSSDEFVAIDDNTIMMPFNVVKGIGDNVIKNVIECRPYDNFMDFLSKVNRRVVNKAKVDALVKAGCFDLFTKNRSQLLEKHYESRGDRPKTDIPFWCNEVNYMFDMQAYGYYLTAHPLDGLVNLDVSTMGIDTIATVNVVVGELRIILDKNSKQMAFVKLNNKNCAFEAICFSSIYDKIKLRLTEKAILSLKIKRTDSGYQILDVGVI